MQDPASDAEWQEAVDAAEFLLQLDSARQYGLLTGGPEIDFDRCVDLVRRGAARGIFPKLELKGDGS